MRGNRGSCMPEFEQHIYMERSWCTIRESAEKDRGLVAPGVPDQSSRVLGIVGLALVAEEVNDPIVVNVGCREDPGQFSPAPSGLRGRRHPDVLSRCPLRL